eukprot:gene5074-5439_t
MSGASDKYIVNGMSTVIICPIDGINLSIKEEMDKIEQKIEKKVKEILTDLKASHSKFIDPDFGPNDEDEYGAKSLYGNSGKPDPAGSKYPAPETLSWERPQYADGGLGGNGNGENEDEEDEDEDDDDDLGYFRKDESKVFCKQGQLFVDGSSSGDVIQGQLGDCWFLSALAVLGTNDQQLEVCFWRRDEFREFGLYVLRFFKDCAIFYVIIDDRLPSRAKDGRLIFAYCKDPNELWVPLIEKGYAKLFGCYKALIGGYTHYGLADMTGFCPRLVVFREGFLGYSEKYSDDEIWTMLNKYGNWKCLMGCSIQPNPKEKNKVEADAGMGLHMSHAYSFLKIGEISVKDANTPYAEKGKIRLVKLRNPWGRGEWEGAFSDKSEERAKYDKEIAAVFNQDVSAQEKIVQDANDGTFLMPFKEWLKFYTSLFVAINFPKEWCGKRTQGRFNGETGGNRDMGTWISNPRFKFRLEPDGRKEEYRSVFIGIYIKDSRLCLGFDYFKDPLYATPIAFDIVTEAELNTNKPNAKDREIIPLQPTGKAVHQPPYNFGTTQVEVELKVGVDYYIVPSLYKKNQPGTFFLNVFADVKSFFLEGATTLVEAQKPMVIGKTSNAKTLPMSVSQFYEKKEALRDRIVSEANRLNLSKSQLENIFKGASEKLTLPQFKKSMMNLGFQLADFPDDDLVVLDIDNDGTISPQEFITFFEDGKKFTSSPNIDAPLPQKPVDDLLYKAIDLSGELNVQVFSARSIREPGSWISNTNKTSNEGSTLVNNDFVIKRGLIKYSSQDALAARNAAAVDRLKNLARVALTQSAPNPNTLTVATTAAGTTPAKTEKPHLEMTHTPRALAASLNSIRSSHALLERATMNSVISEISQTQNEAVKQAGASAGAKLHSDPLIQRAELSRTKHLSLLRSYNKRALGDGDDSESKLKAADSGILRRKTVAGKVKSRDFSKDFDAQILLNYFPSRTKTLPNGTQQLISNQTAAIDGKSTFPSIHNGMDEEVFHHFVAFYDELPGGEGVDLWDYLIDCVFTVVESRSKQSSIQYQTYVKMKQKKHITSSLLLNLDPESAIATTIPTPAVVKGGTSVSTKLKKGHTPTPRSQRRAPGTASVATIQTKVQQRNTLIDAKDKLQALQQEQGTVYEEVFRRIIAVPTIDQHELYGEKKTSEFSSSSSIKVSASITSNLNQIYLLFLKFDKNQNGYISKAEFQLVFKELNIDFSSEDCEIFFHRFSSSKMPENIDWYEFLSFFQTRLLLISPSKPSDGDEDGTNAGNNLMFSNERNISANKMINLLLKIKHIFGDLFDLMVEQKVTSIDHLTDKSAVAVVSAQQKTGKYIKGSGSFSFPAPATKEKPFIIPNNAIFQSLANTQAKHNLAVLKSLGLGNVTIDDVLRIHRIFNYDLTLFMKFIKNDAIGADNDPILPLAASLHEIVNNFDLVVAKELSLRIGCPIIRPIHHLGKQKKTSVPNTPGKVPNIDSSKAQAKDAKDVKAPSEVKAEIKVSPRTASTFPTDKAATSPPPVVTIGDAVIPLPFLLQSVDPRKSTDANGTYKVWNCLNSTNKDQYLTYDAVLAYFQDLLDHSHLLNPLPPTKSTPSQQAEKKEAKNTVEAKDTPPGGAVGDKGKEKEKAREYYGLSTSIILGIIVDALIYSDWNRVGAASLMATTSDNAISAVNNISFSGLDAYIRYSRVEVIEKKLKYLLLLERNLNSPFTYLLIHVCINPIQQELIVIAHDPISNEVYKLQCKEEILATAAANSTSMTTSIMKGNANAAAAATALGSGGPWKDLPVGEKIKQSILDYYLYAYTNALSRNEPTVWNKQYTQNDTRFLQSDAFYLYNPTELPLEDRVISDVVARLKLVRRPIVHNQPYQLILGESPLLIKQMKEQLDAHSERLPFFYILNDLSLRFEIDYHKLEKPAPVNTVETESTALVKADGGKKVSGLDSDRLMNIRNVIFDKIRSLKLLHQFFVSIKSSLTIILSTYNSSIREVLGWDEFLLHLLNYRNCFITVKLLPKFIKVAQYLYESEEQKEKDGKTTTISPTQANIDGEDEDDDDEAEEEDQKPEIVKANKHRYKSFYMSEVDYDGLPHPSFYQLFSFFYEQSKLTSCPIITTEVVRMTIEEVKKYVMIVVREGKRGKIAINGAVGAKSTDKEKFWFLTLYDPRSATEYQCGVKEGCKLHQQLYYHKYLDKKDVIKEVTANLLSVERINEFLHEAAEKNMLIIGPAITPRLEFQVFNFKDSKCQELIGECQISISSVLSNSGVGEKMWTTLIYKMDKSSSDALSREAVERKKVLTLPAGEVEIELSFRRSLEMESDQLLNKHSGKSRRGLTPPSSARGDQNGAPISGALKVKDANREQEKLKLLSEENDKLLEELKKLKTGSGGVNMPSQPSQPAEKTPSSSTVANTTVKPSETPSPEAQALLQKYNDLVKAKNDLDANHDKVTKERDAMKSELSKLHQQMAEMEVKLKSTSSANPATTAPAGTGATADLKALQALSEENKKLKEAYDQLKVTLSQQPTSTKPIVSQPATSNALDVGDFLIISGSGGGALPVEGSVDLSASLSILPNNAINVSATVQQILAYLVKKYEKKSLLKSFNGAIAGAGGTLRSSKDGSSAITANHVLSGLNTLLKSMVNAEGYVNYKQIQEAFLVLQIFVENEIMIRIVHDILGNQNNMNQALNKKYPNSLLLTDLISYLTSECNHILKQQEKGLGLTSSASKAKIRSSNDASNTKESTTKTLMSNDDANVRSSFDKDNDNNRPPRKQRPSSAAAVPLSATAPVGTVQTEGKVAPAKGKLSLTLNSKSSNHLDDKKADEEPKRSDQPIDWSRAPLPEGWERRFHQPKNRFIYIDHQNKKTQWHHPNDTSHQRHQPSDAAPTSERKENGSNNNGSGIVGSGKKEEPDVEKKK